MAITLGEDARADFEQFCRQATDAQLRNILENERAAGENSEYRKACYQAARLVAAERGLATE